MKRGWFGVALILFGLLCIWLGWQLDSWVGGPAAFPR